MGTEGPWWVLDTAEGKAPRELLFLLYLWFLSPVLSVRHFWITCQSDLLWWFWVSDHRTYSPARLWKKMTIVMANVVIHLYVLHPVLERSYWHFHIQSSTTLWGRLYHNPHLYEEGGDCRPTQVKEFVRPHSTGSVRANNSKDSPCASKIDCPEPDGNIRNGSVAKEQTTEVENCSLTGLAFTEHTLLFLRKGPIMYSPSHCWLAGWNRLHHGDIDPCSLLRAACITQSVPCQLTIHFGGEKPDLRRDQLEAMTRQPGRLLTRTERSHRVSQQGLWIETGMFSGSYINLLLTLTYVKYDHLNI